MSLFSRKLSTDSFTNLVSEGTTIDGAVSFSGVIQVEGTVKGDLISSVLDLGAKKQNDCVHVKKTGEVSSRLIRATHVVIAGTVSSEHIWAEDTLRITATASVAGATLFYKTLEIEPGANINDCKLVNLNSDGDHMSKILKPSAQSMLQD